MNKQLVWVSNSIVALITITLIATQFSTTPNIDAVSHNFIIGPAA